MKKKVLSIVLAMSVMATAFTGCGAEENKETGVQASVEATSQESTVESTEASSEASSEASTEASSEANAATGEWATAYDNYFDNNQMLRDNSQMVATISQEGVTMTMVTAVSGENFRMLMDYGVASFDLYVVDGQVYSKVAAEGEEMWNTAVLQSEEDQASIDSMNSNNLKNDNIVSYTYHGEEEIDGVMYDVLDMVIVDDGENKDVVCYINRETQLVDKFTMTEGGVPYDFIVEDIDGVELPAEAASAVEAPMEDIVMGMFTVALAGAMGSLAAAQ